jgi:hypothetical protein
MKGEYERERDGEGGGEGEGERGGKRKHDRDAHGNTEWKRVRTDAMHMSIDSLFTECLLLDFTRSMAGRLLSQMRVGEGGTNPRWAPVALIKSSEYTSVTQCCSPARQSASQVSLWHGSHGSIALRLCQGNSGGITHGASAALSP